MVKDFEGMDVATTTKVPIIWSDEHLIAVNKPSGLPTLPDGYDQTVPYLAGILKRQFDPLWVVHRLDRDTSGVVMLARSAEVHRALNTQFESRQVSKVYHALVVGNPKWTIITVDRPLLKDGDRQHRTIVDSERGKPAVTHLRVLERFQDNALIECKPETGRTHQIRVHLASRGSPIVADALYGDEAGIYLSTLKPDYRPHARPERPLLGRLGLHAFSLMIEHPVTHQVLNLEAPYPKDLAAALRYLRQYALRPTP